MSTANDTQVGGTHYQSGYQHWDFAIRFNLPYLAAAATKYLTRYKKKSGLQDLMKAHHYTVKLAEAVALGKQMRTQHVMVSDVQEFAEANDLGSQKVVYVLVCLSTYYHAEEVRQAAESIQDLIDNYAEE